MAEFSLTRKGLVEAAVIVASVLLATYAVRAASQGADDVATMASRLGAQGLADIRSDEALVAAVIHKAQAQRLHRGFLIAVRSSLEDLLNEVEDLRDP